MRTQRSFTLTDALTEAICKLALLPATELDVKGTLMQVVSDVVDKSIIFGFNGYQAKPKPSGSGQKCQQGIANQ